MRYGIYLHGRPWLDVMLQYAVYFSTYTRYDTLVLGILLAFVHSRYGDAIGAWLRAPAHRALLAMQALACLWVILQPAMFGPDSMQVMRLAAWGTITSLMYFPMLLLLLHGQSWIHRFLSAPIFRKAATLGYGVYLVHIPVLDHVVAPAARPPPRRQGAALPGVVDVARGVARGLLVIGYAMHVLIEKPSLRIRERLAA